MRGTILTVRADTDEGSMQAGFGQEGTNLLTVFESGVQASPTVGAGIFPAIAGKNGAKIKLIFDDDFCKKSEVRLHSVVGIFEMELAESFKKV